MQTNVRGVVASSVVRTKFLGIAAVGALTLSLIQMFDLHLVTMSKMDPLRDTISGYASVEPGRWMLETSVVYLSIGSLALFAALLSAGMPATPTTYLLFGVWVTGLALAALFPATRTIAPTASGEIHWFGSLLAFLSLPAIGYSVARRFGQLIDSARITTWVLRLATMSVAALLVFGLSYLPGKLPDVALARELTTWPIAGLSQRLALAFDVALLAVLGVALLRYTRSVAPSRAPQQP
jgi:hypothetical protein